jgi:hypothetical protein
VNRDKHRFTSRLRGTAGEIERFVVRERAGSCASELNFHSERLKLCRDPFCHLKVQWFFGQDASGAGVFAAVSRVNHGGKPCADGLLEGEHTGRLQRCQVCVSAREIQHQPRAGFARRWWQDGFAVAAARGHTLRCHQRHDRVAAAVLKGESREFRLANFLDERCEILIGERHAQRSPERLERVCRTVRQVQHDP